ncbi:MAG: hypothetical protein FRX49_05982 [Trebouxia sp. A1-2]|nr:MAG: hypothetical protein FRX49_05982 [Trebouxia sp. A1-2]
MSPGTHASDRFQMGKFSIGKHGNQDGICSASGQAEGGACGLQHLPQQGPRPNYPTGVTNNSELSQRVAHLRVIEQLYSSKAVMIACADLRHSSLSKDSQAGGSADSKRKLYLGYECDKISKLFGVFAGLEVEDIQAGFVMTPLQSEVVSVAFRISLDASLTGVPRVSTNSREVAQSSKFSCLYLKGQ